MKSAAKLLASALVDAAAKADATGIPALMDAAIGAAHTQGVSLKELRAALRTALRTQDKTLSALLQTVTGDAGPAAADIARTLGQQAGSAVDLRQEAVPILGGAILTVGDDRTDWSLASALRQAGRALRPSSASAV